MMKLNLFTQELEKFNQREQAFTIGTLSAIAAWNEKYPEKEVNLLTKPGVYFLFLYALLYNYGGGGKGRTAEMLKLYCIIYKENVLESTAYIDLKNRVRRSQIKTVVKFVDNIADNYGDNILQGWWNRTIVDHNDNVEAAAIHVLKQMQQIKFNTGRIGKKSSKEIWAHGLTSKAFWVARELHMNKIWENFPPKYCYVPDIAMVGELIKRRFDSPFLHLFLLSEFLHNELSDGQHPITYDWPLIL